MTDQYKSKRFGEKLRHLRHLHGMAMKDLAVRLGYSSHGYISEIENAKKQPTVEFVLKIAGLFDTPIDRLLNDELALSPGKGHGHLMERPFINRPPTSNELTRLRLILSTYQDGTGMLKDKGKSTLPGWRDFERACALTFRGEAVESKFFIDVVFPLANDPPSFYGIDCKMRRELRSAETKGIIYVEVTNAAKLLWSHLQAQGVTETNFRDEPELAGNALIEAVEILKRTSSSAFPLGPIDTSQSYYLVLLWDQSGEYQLFQLPLTLPKSDNLQWTCFVSIRSDGSETTRLVGETPGGVLYEWYGESGGQLKYYPPIQFALWKSEKFRLEPLPDDIEEGVIAKAKAYFPDLWQAAED